ncbi:hypothetical protein OG874_35620 [Nocardia sp. NBC_00565]|uniref:hypothetical protein n=1 Tax=Nocardia sp. NBC_00565 TaxID=2975993 RepID=UPI002E803B55|nr:hypothetical protein [Nocardia sp. NBC_00565]WUC02020.1 hypothetical protein OG874_35620 [Nocardia sp. NBC_00565]
MISRRREERDARAQRDKDTETDLLAALEVSQQIAVHRCSVVEELEHRQGECLDRVRGRGVKPAEIAAHLDWPVAEVNRLIKLVARVDDANAIRKPARPEKVRKGIPSDESDAPFAASPGESAATEVAGPQFPQGTAS